MKAWDRIKNWWNKPRSTRMTNVKRVIVAVVGGTVMLIGVAATLIPGVPAIVVIPLGLAILATEFIWARRLLKKMRGMFKQKDKPAQ